MPIVFEFEPLRQSLDCKTYLETGLYDVRFDYVSIRNAIRSNFDKIFSIEIRDEWVEIGKQVLSEEIEKNRVEIIKMDSANLKDFLSERTEFMEKTMFLLDAHVDDGNITDFQFRCPILNEIEAIGSLTRKDHVILVDDIRAFTDTTRPWGESSKGDIFWLQEIKNKILDINPQYVFEMLPGFNGDRLMLCFVPM
jgi:hypothetical protein